jgi:hypothetical protein
LSEVFFGRSEAGGTKTRRAKGLVRAQGRCPISVNLRSKIRNSAYFRIAAIKFQALDANPVSCLASGKSIKSTVCALYVKYNSEPLLLSETKIWLLLLSADDISPLWVMSIVSGVHACLDRTFGGQPINVRRKNVI